jgi:hypothetical protein
LEDIKTNELAAEVIKCAKKVHDNLGNCFDKNTYMLALYRELELLRKEKNFDVKKTSKVPLFYKGKSLNIEVFDYSITYKKNKILLKIDNQIPDATIQSKENYGITDQNIIAALAIKFNSDNFEYKVLFSRARKYISCCDKLRQFCKKLCRRCLNCKKNYPRCGQLGSALLFLFAPVIVFILLLCFGNSEIAELLLIAMGSLFLSSIIIMILSFKKCQYLDNPDMFEYCSGVRDKEQCFCKRNQYIWDYSVRKKWIADSNWILEKTILCIVYNIYLRIDFIYNIIKLTNAVKESGNSQKKNRERADLITDVYIIALFLGGIIVYKFVEPDDIYCDFILCSIFIWRIMTILFVKLNEILSHTIGGMHYSFNRTFISFIINIIDVTIGYSYLYSSYYFNVFPGRNMETIFGTLQIFTDWSVDKSLCMGQSVLVLSQVFVFIILISVFLTTMPNLKYLRKK